MKLLALVGLILSLGSSITMNPQWVRSIPTARASLESADLQSQGERKVVYGILIDNTGSLRSQFNLVNRFSKGIVARTHQFGPISLFPFNTQSKQSGAPAIITTGLEWSQDQGQLDAYIDTIFVVPGQTTLIDAIYTIAAKLDAKVAHDKDEFAGKTIFLITDGEDRFSFTSEKDLIKLLKTSGISVYAIGLVKELDDEGGLIRKPTRQKAIELLERITKATGGRVVFPKSKKVDVEASLNELFSK